MKHGESRREENFQTYLRLKIDPNYIDVTFDEKSGGVSAVHKEHKFDKQTGPFGYKRGQYETDAMILLREKGHLVILNSEFPKGTGIKSCDAILDGSLTEIKAIESLGRWTIRTKIANAVKQGAGIVVLYYPDSSLYAESSVQSGWKEVLSYSDPTAQAADEITVLCVMRGDVIQIEKPSR